MKCEDTSVMLSIKPIAYIHSDFSEKFGIPRQSGLVDSLQAKIIFTEEFRNGDCIRGIEEFSHLWLIWEFSKNQRDKWTPTVRPPFMILSRIFLLQMHTQMLWEVFPQRHWNTA